MVCVPCFIIPVLLFLWHKFVQPIVLRFWNPWEKKDKDGKVIKAGPEFPFECKGGVCPFPGKDKNKTEAGANTIGTTAAESGIATGAPVIAGEESKKSQ
ncbi:UPF0729 protein AAEL015238 [Toxorhynchites rutilus septentrionalis]|uniref:UPF0729 protein AAEL015238 n=1 Tax=Toxorhynchites rutilus septentrionalis TaxID=329112 RepID=UPI0024788882|nr:UPF0729 protein AAEL015238 [Toxorhynchites rutilus septentrionalis]